MIPAPLQKPVSGILHYAVQLTLQRGVLLRRAFPGAPESQKTPGYFAYQFPDLWQTVAREEQPPRSLQDIRESLLLKPVLLTVQRADWQLEDFVVPPDGSIAGEIAVQALEQSTHSLRDLSWDGAGPAYLLVAIIHHCRQLARLYRDTALPGPLGPPPSDMFLLHGAVEPYFEFDALITAVVRAYETLRILLWKALGARGSLPRNFERVANALSIPTTLSEPINVAVRNYRQAKDYRDCLSHYIQFGARMPFARLELRDGVAWSMSAWLPDNPEARSFNGFKYDTKVDALDYGWRTAFEVVDFAQTVFDALRSAERAV